MRIRGQRLKNKRIFGILFGLGLTTYIFYFSILNFYIFPNHFTFSAQFLKRMESIESYKELRSVEYLVVGDSTAYKNIQPLLISPESYSLAVPGSSSMDIYNLLLRIDLSKITKGLIITNSFINTKHYGRDYWSRMIMFGFYNFNQFIKNYEIGIKNNIFPNNYSKSNYIFQFLKTKLLFNSRAAQAIWYAPASFQLKESVGSTIQDKMKINHGYLENPTSAKSANFFKAYYGHYIYDFNVSITDDFYFKQILKLMHSKNIQVYFVQPPLAEIDNTFVKVSNYQEGLKTYMENLHNFFPNFHFYQSNLKLKSKAFFDFYHLNSIGSKKFSHELHHLLRQN